MYNTENLINLIDTYTMVHNEITNLGEKFVNLEPVLNDIMLEAPKLSYDADYIDVTNAISEAYSGTNEFLDKIIEIYTGGV